MLCWMNGEFVQAEDLKISPFDHGFLYGVGFFETFRTYNGNLFLFQAHMDRLKTSLSEYQISMPYENENIIAAVEKLNDAAGGSDGYFRLNVSAGVHDIGLAPSSYTAPTVILFRKELPETAAGTEKKGVWLDTIRNNPESAIRHKSHNFLNNVRGRLELPSLREHEGLFLNKDGFVAEGVTSNVFWIKDGELFTPAIETGILPGTTRAFVMEIAEKDGISVNEGFYTLKDVEAADELFVTNSIQEIVPLASIGGKSLPGATGAYYQKLRNLYSGAIENMKEGID
ncbi:aminodeoxychorismate lyase [Sporosarcina jiandibaonis]|uniref:aminodeoxychorismate lyase n=1 Tax=Sporosarcina jiandibaonis TaxID=2715535 RepID=UPI00155826CA|nr:aminodeoxychorismate lyase [Sporosarcina jiandibaonis]